MTVRQELERGEREEAARATKSFRLKAAELQEQRVLAEPGLIKEIEEIFQPAIDAFFRRLREARVRPWPPRGGPGKSTFVINFVAQWRATWFAWLHVHSAGTDGRPFMVATHVGEDLWPLGLYDMPRIDISEDLVLSARALHRIGREARAALPNHARFPEPAAKLLELYGYAVQR